MTINSLDTHVSHAGRGRRCRKHRTADQGVAGAPERRRRWSKETLVHAVDVGTFRRPDLDDFHFHDPGPPRPFLWPDITRDKTSPLTTDHRFDTGHVASQETCRVDLQHVPEGGEEGCDILRLEVFSSQWGSPQEGTDLVAHRDALSFFFTFQGDPHVLMHDIRKANSALPLGM
jgi:hypothetical protein